MNLVPKLAPQQVVPNWKEKKMRCGMIPSILESFFLCFLFGGSRRSHLFWNQCATNFLEPLMLYIGFQALGLLAESNSQPFDQRSEARQIELSRAALQTQIFSLASYLCATGDAVSKPCLDRSINE